MYFLIGNRILNESGVTQMGGHGWSMGPIRGDSKRVERNGIVTSTSQLLGQLCPTVRDALNRLWAFAS